MKAHCPREALLSACQLASVAVPSRDVKPVLRNLKAIAKADGCTLLATDLELGVRLEVRSIKVDEPGEALLPAGRLVAILRETTDEELTLETTNETSVIRGAANEFEMPGEDPAEFPDIPTFADDKHHEISAGALREMIRRTAFAAAKESTRYSMTGVLWEFEDKVARLIATDGRRLAVASGPATDNGGGDTKGQTHVVPTKSMALLERVLQDDDQVVRVCLKPNEALFKTDRATIYTRLVEGRYPNYKEVFPKKTTVKVPLTVGPFLSAVRQAAIMTDEESKRVIFEFAKKKLTLKARGAESGRSKVELPLDYDGKDVTINFDAHYVSDMLRVLPADAALTLELVDGSTPALFKHGTDYSYVVMPLT
ncbi:MAG: DNA polymerase III subunit beta [Gemmataceae bacterium]|nr:DNA polymerase III subunit beta [Gemmataceae bacterium]